MLRLLQGRTIRFAIPTNGVPGISLLSDGGGTHGLNERAGVRAVYLGRDYLFDLVQTYLSQ